jgi:hypothetical protein
MFLGVDDIVKLLSEMQVNINDQAKLKKIFFEKFTLKKVNAKMVDMKLDLILQRQETSTKLYQSKEEAKWGSSLQAKKKPKWGIFVLFGRMVDLSNLIAFLASFDIIVRGCSATFVSFIIHVKL